MQGSIESVECSTGMEWWNGIVKWPHFSHLEGKEGSLGHIMCLKRFFHCAAQTPARDHQQYVSKKFLNLAGLQLLPLSIGEGGVGVNTDTGIIS